MVNQQVILIVDDEPVILDSLSDILCVHGFQVLKASNGLEALEILRDQIPDLILTDIMMPEMNGYQLYNRIRQNPEWVWIPLIFLTAKGEAEDIRFGKELGADDYLMKPIDAEDLIAAILGKLRRYTELDQESSSPTEQREHGIPAPSNASDFPVDLTPREVEVLRHMVVGLNNTEIAEVLFIETSTVKTHVSNILLKLGVSNRVKAVRFAIEHHL
ncbi:MAG: response regulator transcription factor [Chloroflexi bacterium]|nr:response regulator transcription factor [Chloroflexota bacterium]